MNVMNDLKLLPCPFCGKETAVLSTARELEECKKFESEECECYDPFDDFKLCHLIRVVCDYTQGGCGSTGAYDTTEEGAVEKWNRRVLNEVN